MSYAKNNNIAIIITHLMIGGCLLFSNCTNQNSKDEGGGGSEVVGDAKASPADELNADTIYYSEVPGAIKIVREKITKEVDAVEVDKKVKAYEREITKMKEQNPNLKYTYVPDPDGQIQLEGGNYRPEIEGLDDSLQIAQFALLLEVWNTDRNRLREYENSTINVGKEAQPKMGYDKFYKKIQSNISYPDAAQEQGVEGTAFIRFDVNENGEVRNVQVVDSDYDSNNADIVSKLNIQAKDAIMATSGDWIPAKQGDRSITTSLEIPITFNFVDR